MRKGSNIDNFGYFDTSVVDSTDSGFSTVTWTFYVYFYFFKSGVESYFSSIFGGGSDPIDPKANVVFTVVDQYGHGRRCLYQEKEAIQTDVAKYTSPKGVLAFTMPPGYPLTIVFMCGGDSEDQDVEATLVAPETGRAETTVVIPDPDASPSSGSVIH